MNRGVALSILCLAVLAIGAAAVAPATGVQEDGDATNATGWEPPGEFSRDELTDGGTRIPDLPPSSRVILDGNGVVWFNYMPVDPKESEGYLTSGKTIRSRKLGVVSMRLGEEMPELNATLHTIYWERATKRIQTEDGIVPVEYAANQSHDAHEFSIGPYQDRTNVTLQGYYDEPRQVSMWLELGGEEVARWGPYTVETNRLSKPVTITNEQDYWWTTFIRFGWVLLIGLPVAYVGAGRSLERTITGTGFGATVWVVGSAIILAIVVFAAWYQASVLLTQFPFLPGVVLTVLAYFAAVDGFGASVETAEFQQKDLRNTTAITATAGEDEEGGTAASETVTKARFRTIDHEDVARRDGNIYLPAPGVRPFIARHWAEPAAIDESDLKTHEMVDGDISKYYEVDPEAGDTVEITRAHLSFEPELSRELTDEEFADYEAKVSRFESMHWAIGLVATLPLSFGLTLRRINWRYVLIAVGSIAAGIAAASATIGLPIVGALVGSIPGLVAGTRAKDGRAEVTFAPYHFRSADENLEFERETYREARTFEDLHNAIVDLDLAPVEQAAEFGDRLHQLYQRRMNRIFGPEDWEWDTPRDDRNGEEVEADD